MVPTRSTTVSQDSIGKGNPGLSSLRRALALALTAKRPPFPPRGKVYCIRSHPPIVVLACQLRLSRRKRQVWANYLRSRPLGCPLPIPSTIPTLILFFPYTRAGSFACTLVGLVADYLPLSCPNLTYRISSWPRSPLLPFRTPSHLPRISPVLYSSD
ncbi:hypothetical protein LY76DRAFT_320592 [Colletotrichum caudatum]|nr:hypothetical protein LY76DRAFT_320592 [Colletotrichum caudatum]